MSVGDPKSLKKSMTSHKSAVNSQMKLVQIIHDNIKKEYSVKKSVADVNISDKTVYFSLSSEDRQHILDNIGLLNKHLLSWEEKIRAYDNAYIDDDEFTTEEFRKEYDNMVVQVGNLVSQY